MYWVRGAAGFGDVVPVAVQVRRAHQPPETPEVPWVAQSDLGSLLARAGELWPEVATAQGLLAHLVEEGESGDLLTGESPDLWSPLAAPDPASAGRLGADDRLWAGLARRESGADVPEFSPLPGAERLGAVGLRLGSESGRVGSLVFAPDAVVLAVPPGAGHVDLEYVDETLPAEGEQSDEAGHGHGRPFPRTGLEALLRHELPGHAAATYLLVRLYHGDNSIGIDDLVDAQDRGRGHRLDLAALRETGGFVVARALLAVHRRLPKDGRDFTAAKRRLRAEALRPTTARESPDLSRCDAVHGGRAVVAVHGTMACAVPLASSIRAVVPRGTPVLRFEHDTWLAVSVNAVELADHIGRLRLDRVVLVAHSRGGLVARQAAEMLAARGGTAVEVLALGSPHRGTPLVDAVRVGVLGLSVLMGFLRAMGGPTVDASTRIAGLLIRKQLPRGIEAMRTDSEFVADTSFRTTPGCICVAGVVHPRSPGRHHGLAGFARGAFKVDGATAPNDLVVGAASAKACGTAELTVERDHFSYLEDDVVRDLIRERVGALGAGTAGPPGPDPDTEDEGTATW